LNWGAIVSGCSIRGFGRVRAVVLVVVCGLLAGCSIARHTLSATDIASMKLAGVRVSYAEASGGVMWADGMRAWAVARSIPDHEIGERSNDPEAGQFVRNLLAGRIKQKLEADFGARMVGNRPVYLDIKVNSFVITSAAQRIIIGGTHMMNAMVVLVDARSGAVLADYPGLTATAASGQGLIGATVEAIAEASAKSDTAERLIDNFSNSYRMWLIKQ
jgi:hypothetical protein